MFTFEKPFRYGNSPRFYENNLLPIPEQRIIPDEFYKLICQMLAQDPNQRPSATSLKKKLEMIQD